MAALAVAGAAVVARAARGGRVWSLAGAGVLLGLAFEVKLAEALAADRRGGAAVGPRRAARAASAARRARVAGDHLRGHGAGLARGRDRGAAASAAMGAGRLGRLAMARRAGLQRGRQAAARQRGPTAQADVALRTPAHATATEEVALARRAREHAAALARRPTAPGPLRLLSAHAHLGRWIGFEAVAALAALAVALALRRWRGLDRAGRGGLLTLGALARRRRRAVQRDAGIAPALPGLPGSRGGSVPGRGSRPGRAWPSATRTGRGRRAAVRGARVPPRHGAGRGAPRHTGVGAHGRAAGGTRRGAVGLPARAHGRRGRRGRRQRAGQGRAADRP